MDRVAQFFSFRRSKRVGAAVLVIASAMFIISLTTARQNRTIFGTSLGGDFAAFYDAGEILNQSRPAHLYDFPLQSRLYHQLLPHEPADRSLPFANAPMVAMMMRPIARLPFACAYIVWTAISLSLFIIALRLAWLAADLPRDAWRGGLLLLLSFEPLAIECTHGGQLSAIGLAFICAALYLSLINRPVRGGFMLAICIYKPTLLIIILPMLLVMRQWRVLGGFAGGSMALGLLCLLGVGWHACLDYMHTLVFYGSQSAASAAQTMFRTWKFIDLNAFLKLLGMPPALIGIALAAGIAAAIYLLRQMRSRSADQTPADLSAAWACAITCTLVLNLYVGIYDSVLILPTLLLTAGALLRKHDHLPGGFCICAAAIYVLPWCSQILARETGVQVYTIALIALAIYQFRLSRRTDANATIDYVVTQQAAT